MILVFVGAGGSAAVDPKQYPTTRGFFKQLPERVTSDALFTKVCEFLKSQHGIKEPDIEDVLEVLDELQADCQNIADSTTVIGWAMRNSGLIKGINMPSAFQESIAALGREHIPTLSSTIKEQIYELYDKTPDSEKLADWVRLLKGLVKISPALEVFTTNYDRVLENVIREADVEIETGRKSDGIQTRLDTSPWEDFVPVDLLGPSGRLTKLHGSVDWQRSNEGINISEVFTGNHQNHRILYPGYKGEPTEEPFRTFHEHLRKVVNEKYESLTVAIFIGFAFRDDYINRILANLPPETPKFVITKSAGDLIDNTPPTGAPFTDTCLHWRGGFTAKTAEDCLLAISTATGRPLDS